jgi:hypothetical protein
VLFDMLLRLAPGSELRVEATQYLAISLAEPDWDGDDRPDVETPLKRVERLFGGRLNERYVPQVYRGLGDVLFDSARNKQAAEVYHMLIGRWPRSTLVPAARGQLLQIQRR